MERESYYDLAGTLVEQIAYTYDRDGNRTSRTTSAGTETYVYASGARLDYIERGGAIPADFSYDAGAPVTRIERGGLDLNLTYDAHDHVVTIDEAVSGARAEIDFDAMERRTSRRTFVGAALVAAVSFLTTTSNVQGLEALHLVTDASTGAATTGYVDDGEHALARYEASTGDEASPASQQAPRTIVRTRPPKAFGRTAYWFAAYECRSTSFVAFDRPVVAAEQNAPDQGGPARRPPRPWERVCDRESEIPYTDYKFGSPVPWF
ncbi:MAG: hypothetical protein ACFCGT_23945 [Sandaracinaceae bacterium]